MGHYKRFVLTAVCACFSVQVFALNDYLAQYKFVVRGVTAGVLKQEGVFGEHDYHISASVAPSLVANMLGYSKAEESVNGTIDKGRVIPHQYLRMMEGHGDEYVSYLYDLKNQSIDAQVGVDRERIRYTGVVPLDSFSLIAQMLMDIEANHVLPNYTLIDKDNIRRFNVVELKAEIWQAKNGDYLTIRVFQLGDGVKVIKAYFAQNPLRLVKLLHAKKDVEQFSLKLIDYALKTAATNK